MKLNGVFPPIPTPFDANERPDVHALTNNLARWSQTGLAGFVVFGSNGEAVHLTKTEKLRLLEAARQAIPSDRLLIVGTGQQSTQMTIELTVEAARLGADAALVVTPFYYGGKMAAEALRHHYFAVADASPIPIILYNVPKFTHVNMSAETMAMLAQHPNIIGVKDSSGNITQIADTIRLTGPDFQVLAGSGGLFLAALMLGSAGGIMALANVAPNECVELYRLAQTGELEKARDLQLRLIPVNAAVTARFGVAGVKAALDMLGMYGGPTRSPLLPLSDAEKDTLRAILAAAGLLADR